MHMSTGTQEHTGTYVGVQAPGCSENTNMHTDPYMDVNPGVSAHWNTHCVLRYITAHMYTDHVDFVCA